MLEYAEPRYINRDYNDIRIFSLPTNELMMEIAKWKNLMSLEYDSVEYIQGYMNFYASWILFIVNWVDGLLAGPNPFKSGNREYVVLFINGDNKKLKVARAVFTKIKEEFRESFYLLSRN